MSSLVTDKTFGAYFSFEFFLREELPFLFLEFFGVEVYEGIIFLGMPFLVGLAAFLVFTLDA